MDIAQGGFNQHKAAIRGARILPIPGPGPDHTFPQKQQTACTPARTETKHHIFAEFGGYDLFS